jgi:hypothetical protein
VEAQLSAGELGQCLIGPKSHRFQSAYIPARHHVIGFPFCPAVSQEVGMPEPVQPVKMPVVIERLRTRQRHTLSVPMNRDLSLFGGTWQFPRLIGRVLEDGRVDYDEPVFK